LPFSVIIKAYQCWGEVWFGRSQIPVLLSKKPTAIGSDFWNQNRNQNQVLFLRIVNWNWNFFGKNTTWTGVSFLRSQIQIQFHLCVEPEPLKSNFTTPKVLHLSKDTLIET
jgi:hypothetical protein